VSHLLRITGAAVAILAVWSALLIAGRLVWAYLRSRAERSQ
jgi:hypothetical protein